MPADADKVLVIDASIAGAAGQEEATYPTSKNCRTLLRSVLKSSHKIVMTPEIQREWNAHQKSYALEWRSTMNAKKRLVPLHVPEDAELRASIAALEGQRVGAVVLLEAECRIMLKDCHLLEAALETSNIILALDDRARLHLRVAASVVKKIRSIVWVNPDKAEEGAIAWLEEGAEPEKHRQLGFE